MKRLALVPAFCLEWASVALDFCAAFAIAGADFFYDIAHTKRDLDEANES